MTSPAEVVTRPGSDYGTSLVRYCLAAIPVRVLDAGAGVGLLLVAHQRLADPDAAARTGGLLVGLYTVPHLAGPLLARRLDVVRDYRRFLGLAYGSVAVLLACVVETLGRWPIGVVAALIVLAGLGGPLLTGGLSSRLADLLEVHDGAQRRAQGIDAATYGVAATAGPALVAALSGWWAPSSAVLVLCGLAVISAVVVQTLPVPRPARPDEVPRLRDVLPLVMRDPRLRRVNYATMVTAAGQAGLAVVAVQLAGPYRVDPSVTVSLLALMGAGNLVGALVLSIVPLHGDPDRLTTRQTAVVAASFGLCAVAPSWAWGVAAFVLMGLVTAPFVTATFAARNAFAPPDARGQVFVVLSSLKIAAASGGSALAGLLVLIGPRSTLLASGAAVLVAAAVTAIDRRAPGSTRAVGARR